MYALHMPTSWCTLWGTIFPVNVPIVFTTVSDPNADGAEISNTERIPNNRMLFCLAALVTSVRTEEEIETKSFGFRFLLVIFKPLRKLNESILV